MSPYWQNSSMTKSSPGRKKNQRNLKSIFLNYWYCLKYIRQTIGNLFGASTQKVNHIQVRSKVDENLELGCEGFEGNRIQSGLDHFDRYRSHFIFFWVVHSTNLFSLNDHTKLTDSQLFSCWLRSI